MMKRKMLRFMVLTAMLIGVIFVPYVSAEWGYRLTDRTLTIDGTGAMEDYASFENTPWHAEADNIKTVIIADGITSVGAYAFENCTALESLTIGENVAFVGEKAFSGCTGLEELYWNAKSVADFGQTNNIFADCGTAGDGMNVVFGSGVMHIPAYLFYPKYPAVSPKTENITFSGSVSSVGACAFYQCDGLTDIVIGDDTTTGDSYIGNAAFCRCKSLENVTIGDRVTSIGESVFGECDGITEIVIGKGITCIPMFAFYKCKGLERVVIGENVTEIWTAAFSYCTALKEITFGANVSFIDVDTFHDCYSLEYIYWNVRSIDFHDGDHIFDLCGRDSGGVQVVFGETVEHIPAYMFFAYDFDLEHACYIKSVTMGDNVTSIGEHAFQNCMNLQTVILSKNITVIEEETFKGCTSLANITLPDGITSIGNTAFEGCDALKELLLPTMLETIGEGAFSDCSALTDIIIPNGVTSISNNAFLYCKLMESIAIPDSVIFIGDSVFYGCVSLREIALPAGLTEIGMSMFEGCSALKNVIIGENVTSIGDSAFMDCIALASLTIPDSVVSIGGNAFSGCASLNHLVVPNSVATIGARAFSACTALEEISIPFIGANADASDAADAVFGYIFDIASVDGTIQVDAYYSSTAYATYYVPASLKKVHITDAVQIPYGAFDGCRKIEYISLNEGVTTISRNAFANCAFLSLYMPKSVTRIGSNAFSETDIEMMYVSQDSFCHTYAINNSIPYTIYDTTPVAKITLSASELTMSVGDTAALTATVTPEDTAIVWTTSASDVATVENGVVTAHRAGTAIITAVFADGSKSASCTVTVQGAVLPPSDAPQIVLIGGTTAPHTTITVDVCIANNPGFISLNLQIDYDSTYLTLTDIKANPAVGAVFTKAPSFDKIPYNFAWNSSENVSFNGTLATLVFSVSAAAPNAEYPISVSYYTGPRGNYTDGVDVNFDAEYKPLGLFYVDGSISVVGRTKGDANGDNTINDQDITWMLRYLAGWNIPGIVVEALNVDGNAVINNRDATHLLRYLAGWDVVLR